MLRTTAVLVLLLLASAASEPGPPPLPSPVSFNATFSPGVVLQRAPAKAAVYGMLGDGGQSVSIKVSSSGGADYSVAATVNGQGWIAYLQPAEASTSTFTITATCKGCTNSTPAVLDDVVFGDVWYCAGERLS